MCEQINARYGHRMIQGRRHSALSDSSGQSLSCKSFYWALPGSKEFGLHQGSIIPRKGNPDPK